MKAHGNFDFLYDGRPVPFISIIVNKASHATFKKWYDANKKDPDKPIDITITAQAKLSRTQSGGILMFETTNRDIFIEQHFKKRSLNQENTLRGIERFIFWADEGRKPLSHETYYIHEALLQLYSPEVENPVTGVSSPMRTNDPKMTTKIMADLINGALNHLYEKEIDDDVATAIGIDVKAVFSNWYNSIYKLSEEEIIEHESKYSTWEIYKQHHPICELCGKPYSEHEPLVRMHLVAGLGKDSIAYDEPWSYVRACISHHTFQHNNGWNDLLKAFPSIKLKWERANLLAKKGSNIEDTDA